MDRIHAAVSGGCLHGNTQSSLQVQFPIRTSPIPNSSIVAQKSGSDWDIEIDQGRGYGYLLYLILIS